MLCKPFSPAAMGSCPGYDPEKLRKIRELTRVVFGRESSWSDTILARQYNLSPAGELIMILR
jgi:hypothetical protein